MTDLELLELLTSALTSDPGEPPPDSLSVLHRAVDARTAFARESLRVRRRWVVPAVAAFSVLGISGGAFAATGASLPHMARRLAYDVGLPVDSPRLHNARSHRDALQAALARHDAAAIATESAKLREELDHLDSDEHNRVGNDTDALLQQADNQIHPNDVEGTQLAPTATAPTTAPTTATTTATTTTRDAPTGDAADQPPDNQPVNNPGSHDQPTNEPTTVGQVDVEPITPPSPGESSSSVTADLQSPTTTTATTTTTTLPTVETGPFGEP